ncbi:hypothetical protein ACFX1R_044799 [Malus domestica]|uniref:glutamate receptor 2.7-like n=1 Tax=Malus domestica TaxID=3750 RepID=UPI003976E418
MKRRTRTNLVCSFFLLISLSINLSLVMGQKSQNTTIPVKVGVVLDDLDSSSTKVWLSCIEMALSDFYTSRASSSTRLALSIRDSREDVVDAAAAALDLIKNLQVQAILGPKSSMQANFVIDLGEEAQVPIMSFSATSPSLTSIRSPYFFRAVQNDSSQVKAISAIIEAFGWREAVPIYVDNEYGEGIIPYLADALQEVEARIPYRSVIPPEASDVQIEAELYKLMTMQTRVFIVHMLPSLGNRLFAKAQEMGMMDEGYVWIMTGGLTNHITAMSSSVRTYVMEGALGVRTYVPQTVELKDFRVRWKKKFQMENPSIIDAELDVPALRAYDAAFALAMAVENVGTRNFGFEKINVSTNSSTDLEALGLSQNGPELCKSLASTKFIGLAGDFSFVDGQLQPSIFEMVNVIGHGARTIGFWTPQGGLVKKLKFTNTENTTYSTSKSNLGPILWPGDSSSVPKGWENPTYGKRLKVGVPVIDGFADFVRVVPDPSNNTTEVSGFCIDVFDAAMRKLPYAVSYDLIPFAKPDGTSAGTYSDLVHQVFLGKFDALAADTTIRANRSLYVDFTLPYTESGVVMVVPMKDGKSKNAWIFLKPLTWDLWLTSSCFFIFIGFVVWVLEHRINEEFRGPPLHQVGTSFWFSFSTMVFAHRETVISNLARFVVIVWVFVVLVLTQSYTASLTSLLTVQQLQPTFTNLSVLIKNKEYIGYINGSFVRELLIQNGVDPSQLRPYNSSAQCNEFLANGGAKGGIAAAIDETPNMKLFLAKYCSTYTMIGPIFKTDGFGFVFPKGSPLVSDVSRAILNVTEGDEMKDIENKWFTPDTTCSDTKPTISNSNSLGLDSFWGLFLIAGVSSISALIIFAASFCYRHRHIFMTTDASGWKRIRAMLRFFDQKDLSSHTFRQSGARDGTSYNVEAAAVEASPNNNTTCPPSPESGRSNDADQDSHFFREQGTPVGEIPNTPEGAQETNN